MLSHFQKYRLIALLLAIAFIISVLSSCSSHIATGGISSSSEDPIIWDSSQPRFVTGGSDNSSSSNSSGASTSSNSSDSSSLSDSSNVSPDQSLPDIPEDELPEGYIDPDSSQERDTSGVNEHLNSTTIIPGVEASPDLYKDCDNLCTAEEGADIQNAVQVNKVLLAIPRWIRTAFLDLGWKMVVVPYDIATADYSDQYPAHTVRGSTVYREKTIKIQNENSASVSAIHEMGHWLDSFNLYPTLNDDDLIQIIKEERDSYNSVIGSAGSTEMEFFAEAFSVYWKSPKLLYKAAPKFYKYLNALLKKDKENYLAGKNGAGFPLDSDIFSMTGDITDSVTGVS